MAKKANAAVAVEGTVTVTAAAGSQLLEGNVTANTDSVTLVRKKPRGRGKMLHEVYALSQVAYFSEGEEGEVMLLGNVEILSTTVADINSDVTYEGNQLTIVDADGDTYIVVVREGMDVEIVGETEGEAPAPKAKGKAPAKGKKKEETEEEEEAEEEEDSSEEEEEEEKPKKGKGKAPGKGKKAKKEKKDDWG